MRLIVLAGLLMVAALGSAQDATRIKAIWAAVDNRFSTQTDAWFEDGEFPMTIQLLKMQVDLDPHNYEIATNLGWMLENIEENDQAVAVYEEYRRNNLKDPDAAMPLAEHWFRRRQYEKVIATLPQLTDKAHPNNFRILAHSYDRVGKQQQAESVWKRYLKLHPKDLTAVANLKKLQAKMKDGGNR